MGKEERGGGEEAEEGGGAEAEGRRREGSTTRLPSVTGTGLTCRREKAAMDSELMADKKLTSQRVW